MSPTILSLFWAALFLVSFLYSCVGQARASGYIAAMALFGLAPGTIKPTALVLNVLVSSLVAFRFFRAGHLDWKTFWPLAIASAPAALLGGYLTLPALFFNRLLGMLLLLAAAPLFLRKDFAETAVHPPGPVAAALAGSGIGLVSGLTGVGGGVLITPILLYCRWATGKRAAAISAVFILLNSTAALIGHFSASHKLPPGLPLFALSALAGGAIGSHMGSIHLSLRHLSDSGRNPAARRGEALFHLKGSTEIRSACLILSGGRQIELKKARDNLPT